MRNALDIRVKEIELRFPSLPAAFDGYRLLHIADPHLGLFPGLTERIIEIASSIDADLCVMTGDYRPSWRTPVGHVIPALEALVASLRRPDGVVAVLGNHDPQELVGPLQRMGVTVLAHSVVSIARDGARIEILGVDDRLYRTTRSGRRVLADATGDFVVALVHSPRYAETARGSRVNFYLCGHTHAGQVCLPGGIAVWRPRGCGTRMAGRWRVGTMQGYTSAGAGVSVLPVRFNCPGEITRITLRRGEETP